MNNSKVYRRGLRMVRVLPIGFLILVSVALIWLALDGRIKYSYALYGIGISAVFVPIWMIRNIAKWKLWMVEHADKPKVVLEQARESFLKPSIFEKLAFLSSDSRRRFEGTLATRIQQYREEHLKLAKAHRDPEGLVTVRKKLGPMLRWLAIVALMVAVGILIALAESDPTILAILIGSIILLAFLGYLAIRSVFRRLKTVLEINQHGIRIHNNYLAWEQIKMIDVVRESVLVYETLDGKSELDIRSLELDPEELDEIILFYRTTFNSKKDNPTS